MNKVLCSLGRKEFRHFFKENSGNKSLNPCLNLAICLLRMRKSKVTSP